MSLFLQELRDNLHRAAQDYQAALDTCNELLIDIEPETTTRAQMEQLRAAQDRVVYTMSIFQIADRLLGAAQLDELMVIRKQAAADHRAHNAVLQDILNQLT
jgi:hypothetical protein